MRQCQLERIIIIIIVIVAAAVASTTTVGAAVGTAVIDFTTVVRINARRGSRSVEAAEK